MAPRTNPFAMPLPAQVPAAHGRARSKPNPFAMPLPPPAQGLPAAMGAAFVRGAADVPLATAQSAARAAGTANLLPEFEAIERGEQPPGLLDISRRPPVEKTLLRQYAQATPERRAEIKARAQQPVTESPVYKAAERGRAAVEGAFPVDPAQGERFLTKAAGGLGSTLGFAATGIAGRALGMPALPVTAATGAAANSQAQFQQAINSGASFEDATRASQISGLAGLSEAMPISRFLDRFDKGTGGTIRKALREGIKGGIEESVQEIGQAIVDNATARGIYDPERGLITGAGEAGAIGFSVGSLMSFLASALGARIRGGREPSADDMAARGFEKAPDGSWRLRSGPGRRPSGPETIQGAAVRFRGKTYTGQTHTEAAEAAAQDLGLTVDQVIEGATPDDDFDAFMTSTGRLVNRLDAGIIAEDRGQVSTGKVQEGGLIGEHLTPPDPLAGIFPGVGERGAPDLGVPDPLERFEMGGAVAEGHLAGPITDPLVARAQLEESRRGIERTEREIVERQQRIDSITGVAQGQLAGPIAPPLVARAQLPGRVQRRELAGVPTGKATGRAEGHLAGPITEPLRGEVELPPEPAPPKPDVPTFAGPIRPPKATPQVQEVSGGGTKYVLPSFVTKPHAKPKPADPYEGMSFEEYTEHLRKRRVREGIAHKRGPDWWAGMDEGQRAAVLKELPDVTPDEAVIAKYARTPWEKLTPTVKTRIVRHHSALIARPAVVPTAVVPPSPEPRPPAAVTPQTEEHPGLVIKSLETGRTEVIQPPGTRPPAGAAAGPPRETPPPPRVEAAEPAPQSGRGQGALRVEPLGKAGLIVRGDTKPNKDRIKALGGKWSGKHQGWIFPKTREGKVREGLADLLGAPATPAAETAEAAPAHTLPAPVSPPDLVSGLPPSGDAGAEITAAFGQAARNVAMAERMRSGERISLAEARNAIAGRPIEAGTADAKQAEEQIEAVLVETAREIVREGMDPAATFDELLKLQNNAPTLQTRTSGSMQRQAYSTPIAIAYMASRLASASRPNTDALEPTAGNGALLIERDRQGTPLRHGTVANELDPARADNLKRQFGAATELDATTTDFGKGYDAILANPPFGALILSEEEGRARWPITDPQGNELYVTGEIDHAIAWNALKSLAPDGSAVLLLAGPSPQALQSSSDEHRRKPYMSGAKQRFYYALYDHFRVTDHFTLEGDLYKKQGAAWPIDIVVIHGRGKSSRPLPARQLPRVITSWDEVKELAVYGGPTQERPGVAPGEGEPVDSGGVLPAGAGDVRDDAPVPGAAGRPGDVDAGELPGGLPAGGGQAPGERPAAGARSGTRGSGRSGARGGSGRPAARPGGEPAAEGAAQAGGGTPGGGAAGVGEQPDRGGRRGATAKAPALETFTDAELDAALDAALGPSEGPTLSPNPSPAPPPTAGEAAASAAQNATQAIDQALTGIFKLLGGDQSGTLGSGPIITEETYQAARPHFQAAWQATKAAGGDLAAFLNAIVGRAQAAYGPEWERHKDALRAMLRRFAQEMRAAVKPAPAETSLQKAYAPASKGEAIGTLTPTNLVDPIQASLSRIEQAHGSVDGFIRSEMGWSEAQLAEYLAAEQIDALALALDKLKKGGGFIIGDQTGVGKGRVNAAIIQWAKRNKMIPVFLTEKPNLYADMMRDLADTGAKDFTPLLTNSGLSGNNAIPLPDGKFLETPGSAANDKRLAAAYHSKFKGYDGIFSTYNQTQTVKGAKKTRHQLLDAAMPNAILILDESHNAGGTVKEQRGKKELPLDRAALVRQWVEASKGTFYSSATFAKRPDVMSLYSKTGLGRIPGGQKKLEGMFAKGGLALQQVASSMLARAGEYIRRERSFDGVDFDGEVFPTNTAYAEQAAEAMREINDFERAWIKPIITGIKEDTAGAGTASGNQALNISSTNFTAIMHNVIDQMLLAAKADAAVERARASIEAGEKPVIAVSNTMGSILDEIMTETGVKTGQRIDFRFNHLLARYLERTRHYTKGGPYSKKKERKYITDEELGPEGVRIFNAIREAIMGMDFGGMPGSPIDYIKGELQRSGYKVGELTGRNLTVDYADGGRVKPRPASEKSKAGVVRQINGFNSGDLDAIVINQSGATGLSLHASEKFKDQRRRRMIIAQPEKNIDTFMQMLGRVHRTGQVIAPAYTLGMADMPAEKRPGAVLMKKLKSLNANTTASAESQLDFDLPDFMDDVGDRVAALLLRDNPEIDQQLGFPLDAKAREADEEGIESAGTKGGGRAPYRERKVESKHGDNIRKMTGRIPLLPVQQQEEIYSQLVEAYNDEVARMRALGQNVGAAETLDLDAQFIERTQIATGEGEGEFGQPAHMAKASVKRQGKSMTRAEALAELGKTLGADPAQMNPQVIRHTGRAETDRLYQFASEEFQEYVQARLGSYEDPAARQKEAERLKLQQARVQQMLSTMPVGQPVYMRTDDGNYHGLVTGLKRSPSKTGSPMAPNRWKLDVAVADPMRKLTVTASNWDDSGVEWDTTGGMESALRAFDQHSQVASREERFVITGNILAGFAAMNGKGKVVFFTDAQGETRSGVLMPKKFQGGAEVFDRPVELKTPEHVIEFAERTGSPAIGAEDLSVTAGGGRVEIRTAGSKAKGGRIFLNPDVLQALGGQEFVKAGNKMRVIVNRDLAAAALKKIIEIAGPFEARDFKDTAYEITGQARPVVETAADGKFAGEQPIAAAIRQPYDETGGQVELHAGLPLGKVWDWWLGPFFQKWYEPFGRLPGREEYLRGRYKALGEADQIGQLTKHYYDRLARHPEQVREQIYQYLTTPGAAPTTVTDPIARQDAIDIKRTIDRIGRELVHYSVLEPGQYAKYRDRYLPRIYLRFLLDETAVSIGAGNRPKVPAAMMGSIKKRKDLSRFERDILLGEVKDPAYLAARAFGVAAHSIAILRFLDQVSQNADWVYPQSLVSWRGRRYSARYLMAEAARLRETYKSWPDHLQQQVLNTGLQMEAAARSGIADPPDPKLYKQVPDTKRYGMLRGLWIKSEIYDDLVGSSLAEFSNETMSWLAQGWRTGINWWKIGKTSLNLPAGHIRNHVSGAFQAGLFGGVGWHSLPTEYLKTINDLAHNGPRYQAVIRHGGRSTSFSASELAKIHDAFRLKAQTRQYRYNPVRFLTEIGAQTVQWFGDKYSGNEVFWKALVMGYHMDRGMPEADAALKAHAAVFDYSLVPWWIRAIRQNVPLGAPFACVDEQTEALTKRGWLGIDEITEGDHAASFDMATGRLVWKPVTGLFRAPYEGDLIHFRDRHLDMMLTPDHRCVTSRRRRVPGQRAANATEQGLEIVRADTLNSRDSIPVAAPFDREPEGEPISDAMVEVLGWVVTEGSFSKVSAQVWIFQNEGVKAATIRRALKASGVSWQNRNIGRMGVMASADQIRFTIHAKDGRRIRELLPNKQLTPALLHRLSAGQLRLLVDTMIAGDGCVTGSQPCFIQNAGETLDSFCMALVMLGESHGVYKRSGRGFQVSIRTGKRYSLKRIAPQRVQYDGRIWCPQVADTGIWLARRNGRVFVTGNTFMYKALPQSLETLFKRPWAYWPVIGGISFLTALTAYYQDLDDDEEAGLTALLPPWLSPSMTVILPMRDAYGRFMALDLSYFFPFGGWLKAAGYAKDGEIGKALDEIGMGNNPGFQIPKALLTNQDGLGRPVWDEGDPAHRQWLDFLSYMMGQALPPWAAPEGSIKQLHDAITSTPDRYGHPPRSPMAGAARFMGFTTQSMDVEVQFLRGTNARLAKIRDAEARQREIAREHGNKIAALSEQGKDTSAEERTMERELERQQAHLLKLHEELAAWQERAAPALELAR